MTAGSPDEFTRLLNLASSGDQQAAEAVLPLVIQELRVLARARLHQLPQGQTLQPTALVNEVWVRLVDNDMDLWEGRAHFYFVAARAMRDILVEDARRKATEKRGGGRQRVELDEIDLVIESPVEDMIELDQVLDRLEAVDPVGAQLVMLRFFTGLQMEETARALDISLSTAERKWRFVRAWLRTRLEQEL